MGGIDAARELGGLTPALVNGALSNPAVQRALRANATTAPIHQFAEKDALRSLGNRYFGEGQARERAFASFAQNVAMGRASYRAGGCQNASVWETAVSLKTNSARDRKTKEQTQN